MLKNKQCMNTILFATDFSEASEHAFRQVLPVADQLRAKIYFVHVEHVPATDIQASGGMLEQVMQHRRQAAMEGLNKMKWETAEFAFNNNTHIESDHILTTGMIVEEIIHAADSIQPQFVVLGVPSHHHFPALFGGSVAGTLIRKCSWPLLLFPPVITRYPAGDILFASGWDAGDEEILSRLMTLAAQLRKKVQLLHISQARENGSEQQVEAYIRKHFSKELESGHLRSVVLYEDDITGAVLSYMEANEISLLVAGHHKHMIEAFHRQIAVKLSDLSHTPVLIYQS